jgi:ribosome-associated protein
MTSLQIAHLCAEAADHRKGEDISVLDLRGISSVADFFVIVSGSSEPHLKAIRNEIEHRLKEENISPKGIDGFPQSQWVVMDYIDVMVHIFNKGQREFYALERLWGDAKFIDWQEEPKKKAVAK